MFISRYLFMLFCNKKENILALRFLVIRLEYVLIRFFTLLLKLIVQSNFKCNCYFVKFVYSDKIMKDKKWLLLSHSRHIQIRICINIINFVSNTLTNLESLHAFDFFWCIFCKLSVSGVFRFLGNHAKQR